MTTIRDDPPQVVAPAGGTDDAGAALARRIHAERAARGWSLADLAARSGVAKATLSRIERGEMSPTAALLVRVAAAFDLSLAGLLVRAETGGRRVSRAATQSTWRDPDAHYTRMQVFVHPDHPVELVHVTLPAGARVALPAASYARIRQVVWVQTGTLTITEGGERHDLHPGDALGFGPPADAEFANATPNPCTYVVALARS